MNKSLAILVGLILLVFLILFSTTYSVSFHEVAIRQTFGQADNVITEPGLNFKLPVFADQVTKLDRRLQLLELPQDTIATADGQQIVVKAFLLWQIDVDGGGTRAFDTSYRSIENAQSIISNRFKTAVTSGLSRYRFSELIGAGSRLADAEDAIRRDLMALQPTGVLPVSVGVSQVLMPQRTAEAVLRRMEATRETLASAERYKGNAEAERIESEARTMADKIIAFASQRAEEIRAQGNEEAARYIAQMSEDEDLAIFLVHLDALEAALSQRATVVLEADTSPWHYMNIGARTDSRGFPLPSRLMAERTARKAAEGATEQPVADDKKEPVETARAENH